jgi:hypothetical protein
MSAHSKRIGPRTTLLLLVGAASMLAIGPTAIAAEAATNDGITITHIPVSFVLTSAACSFLPPGTTVTGSGTETGVTSQSTSSAGVTSIANSTHADGRATDQAGNVYQFKYNNQYRITNSVGSASVYTGVMTDTFTLSGNGPVLLHNGFVSDMITDPAFSSVTWTTRHVWGDPISFAPGPVFSHCDPL